MVQFISAVTGQIQEINNIRDDLMTEAEEDFTALFEHYKLIKESLLSVSQHICITLTCLYSVSYSVSAHSTQKLSAFTAKSDRMQKEYRVNSANPFRLMSDRYLGCIYDVKEGEEEESKASSVIKNFFFGSEQSKEGTEDPFQADLLKAVVPDTTLSSSKAEAKTITANETFAQRYIDEIAPQSKMREYEAVAVQQKDVLLREARQLKVRYSEDIQESQRMERTMNNITSMISEFVQLIESQTVYVDAIGEVSQDTTSAVKSADAELLLTLERTQSHQWSMISFIVGMALLLLVLDFLSP